MAIPGTGVCPKCARKIEADWRLCPACATPLDGATQTVFAPASSSSSSIEEGRFPAGTVLAARYRILGLLGRGGMGEVYRAYDLILEQSVALKFLPQANVPEAVLARFRSEVRIARQVSHPNVCRVYDIGFVEGMHFLSMEYLDGEDLSSLLRRIGRLPQDKALEFTRKICAGLAAAHERGVLHRDLKPSNIMIDGRGQVRITDFGLAALAAEIPIGDLRSGTPAYMSPEQKSGKEVTTRSDLYSLGLVVHEIFTGKHRADTQTSPSELVKDLDPAIERVILRCLEEEPKRRPQSALHVAMALPGGDPIAAALAAGETPSPEMVAASQEKEGFSRRTAIVCFMALLVCLAALRWFDHDGFLQHAPLEIPPEALADRAQEMLRRLGYTGKPQSTAYGFGSFDPSALRHAQLLEPARRDAVLASHQPAVIGFWYRQHRGEIRADLFPGDAITFDSPANDEPGMIRMYLDATGRLLALEARPADSGVVDTPPKAPDWNALLLAARLDPARFTPAAPQQVPPTMADARMAWTGTFAEGRTEQVRVEAAAWQGRPVYFRVAGDWQQQNPPPPLPVLVTAVRATIFVTILVGLALLARHNLRQGRSDRRGAARLAAAYFVGWMCVWILTADHVASSRELGLLIQALSFAAFLAGLFWALHLAIEPFVRRYWPDALIPVSRLLAGRVRDPLVASNLLAGIVLAEGSRALYVAVLAPVFGLKTLLATPGWALEALKSVSSLAGILILAVGNGAALAALLFFVGLLVRIVARRGWIAGTFFVLLAVVSGLPDLFRVTFLLSMVVGGIWMLQRLGLLAFLTAGATAMVSFELRGGLSSAPGSWYASRSLLGPLVLVAAAAWALWVILSAQRRPAADSRG